MVWAVAAESVVLAGAQAQLADLGLAAALADARVVALPGQQHLATYTAPELFVNEIVRFLGSLPARSQKETTP